MNIDAGNAENGMFFLSTGGDITNEHVPLNDFIKVDGADAVPEDVVKSLKQ